MKAATAGRGIVGAALVFAGLAGLAGTAHAQANAQAHLPQPIGHRVDVGWSPNAMSSALPPQFVDEAVAGGWNQAIGLTYADDGRLFVWEKAGRVWIVDDGVKAAAPFLDLSEEVASWGDHGLSGFALDPGFLVNGFVYLLYAVDYHHLAHFGTPTYDPLVDEVNRDTQGRVTRYTANALDGFNTVIPASRTVLLGESVGNGIPICTVTHGTGALQFGTDGSLLVSAGDGAGASFSWTCLSDGLIAPEENVEQFRAQQVDSQAGKILRLDPATGDGYTSNPFFDGAFPRSARSRVWSFGLRNPFRFHVRPGSGSFDPGLGDPGTLLVADVGDMDWEELNVVKSVGVKSGGVKTGGANLGWPLREGLRVHAHAATTTANPFADNPLFGTTPPGQGPCTQEHFAFQDLFVEDTLNAPAWPNPCDPGQAIPAAVAPSMHRRPALAYGHVLLGEPTGTEVPGYDGTGEAVAFDIESPLSPVAGSIFKGNAVIAGTWYQDTDFPPQWRDGFYCADYQSSWIRFLKFDRNDDLVSIADFSDNAGRIVAMASSPAIGGLTYVNFSGGGLSSVRHIRYVEGNLPPVAAATAEPVYGPSLLDVQFDASASFDPEALELSFAWDFGDGTPVSILPAPRHRFPAHDVTAFGSVVSRLDELVPPNPMGLGAGTPVVMHDDVYPDLGAASWHKQFDTYHYAGGDPENVDKNGVDYLGYTFATSRTLMGVVFQEGINVDGSGGYFDELHVQVLVGAAWQDVTGLSIDPPYPGDLALSFEHFRMLFDPVTAEGVRLWGVPGGTYAYVSAGELRVLGVGPAVMPEAHDVTVTVTDAASAEQSAQVTVFTDNSPPLVEILSPAMGAAFPSVAAPPLQLAAAVTDAEHGPGELSWAWQVILHHNEHDHPGAVINEEAPLVSVFHDACDGDPHWVRIKLTVTDALGLATTAESLLAPDCDCDMSGAADVGEIAADPGRDLNGDGTLDACQADCNGNGLYDAFEVHFKLTADRNGNGIPDACDPHVTLRPASTTPEMLGPTGGPVPGGETTTAGGAASGH